MSVRHIKWTPPTHARARVHNRSLEESGGLYNGCEAECQNIEPVALLSLLYAAKGQQDDEVVQLRGLKLLCQTYWGSYTQGADGVATSGVTKHCHAVWVSAEVGNFALDLACERERGNR